MSVIDLIAEDIKQHNVVLFVGAGLSIDAGLPNWTELIRPLAVQLGTSLPPSKYLTYIHLLQTAEAFEQANGRHTLIRRIRDALFVPGIKPTRSHLLISAMQASGTVITTNYDRLIEIAYGSLAQSYTVVATDSDLSFWDEHSARVIKLRGDIDRFDLVVTQSDYDTYSLKNPLLCEGLRQLFLTKSLVFLGYSLSDPDIHALLSQLQFWIGSLNRPKFLISFDITETERARWRTKDVLCHSLDTSTGSRGSILEDCLEFLAKSAGVRGVPK